ncbi:MAG: type III-A CRISPR-associated RAMP protein Csm4 [Bryobacteraceae bacterium]
MNPALLVKIRPSTPWRLGPETGSLAEASAVLHSDAIYSAVTLALGQLGWMEEWLAATADPFREPAVRFTSAFPWQRNLLYLPPPRGLWPPEGSSLRVRWKGASHVPAPLAGALLRGERPAEDAWRVDGPSGCLIPAGGRFATGPFRFLRRSCAAVDRVTGGRALPYLAGCVQFAPASGLWCAAWFATQTAYAVWGPKIEAAFRLLGDSGIGGLRSRGFGRARHVDFQAAPLGELLFGPRGAPPAGNGWWLLSLMTPAPSDTIRWEEGDYELVKRSGRVGSLTGGGLRKPGSRMVAEGSVLVSRQPPRGTVLNVAPEGCPHPVFRAGYAVAVPIPWPEKA